MVLNPILLVEPAVSAVQDGSSNALMIALVVGFIAAATLGSVAWYNSKRPPGWEDKERPDIVPEVEK